MTALPLTPCPFTAPSAVLNCMDRGLRARERADVHWRGDNCQRRHRRAGRWGEQGRCSGFLLAPSSQRHLHLLALCSSSGGCAASRCTFVTPLRHARVCQCHSACQCRLSDATSYPTDFADQLLVHCPNLHSKSHLKHGPAGRSGGAQCELCGSCAPSALQETRLARPPPG